MRFCLFILSCLFSLELQGQALTYPVPAPDTSCVQEEKAAYKEAQLKVTLVPIHGTSLASAKELQDALNAIFRRSVVDCSVSVDNSFSYTKAIHISSTTNDQKPYDPTMEELIAAYKKTPGYRRKEFHVFVIDKFSTGASNTLGYMPYYSRFGFVVNKQDVAVLSRWLAHELGHGAFGLQHTDNGEYYIPQAKGNLMSYKEDGRHLSKFQWDIIHEGNGEEAFESAEEVMAMGEGNPDFICISDNSALKALSKYSHFYLPDGRGVNLQGKYQLANNQRLAQDVQYQQSRQQKHGGKATNTKPWKQQKIGTSTKQHQMKDELCDRIDNEINATDIRVNQTQSNAAGQGVGTNRPDIAPLVDRARYYIEIDAVSSNRGLGHLQRIIANDPAAASGQIPAQMETIVKDVCLKYNCTYTVTGRVILIQE